MVNGRSFFGRSVKSCKKTLEVKISINNHNDYNPGCLLDYLYFFFSKLKNVTGSWCCSKRNARNQFHQKIKKRSFFAGSFILQEAKETMFDFSQDNAIVS